MFNQSFQIHPKTNLVKQTQLGNKLFLFCFFGEFSSYLTINRVQLSKIKNKKVQLKWSTQQFPSLSQTFCSVCKDYKCKYFIQLSSSNNDCSK